MVDTLLRYATRGTALITLIPAIVELVVGQPLWGIAWLGISLGFWAIVPKKSKSREEWKP